MSYSQYGESDVMLKQFPEGFIGRMLEIGAYDPKQFSNSRDFIERGWEAVLVEPTPLAVESLLREYGNNPKVKVVAGAVSLDGQPIHLRVTADAVSTCNEDVYSTWRKDGGYYSSMWAAGVDLAFLAKLGPYNAISIDAEGLSVSILTHILQFRLDLTQSGIHPLKVICVEFDREASTVRHLAAKYGYEVVLGPEVNGTNMILVKA